MKRISLVILSLVLVSLVTACDSPVAPDLITPTPVPTATVNPSILRREYSPIPRTDVESRIACDMSEHFVKQNSKSPSTAKFPNAVDYINGDGCTALFNNGVWSISSWVDSQNSAGATLRTHYVAQLTHDNDGSLPAAADATWHLKDLLFVD